MRYAVCRQETGEEGILHRNDGETEEQLMDRVPEEWTFLYWETPYAERREELEASLIAQHAGDEDYDHEAHMDFLDDQQERYDEQWR